MTAELRAVDDGLGDVEARLADLRHDVGALRHRAAHLRGRGTQLVALDLSRALVALGAANLSLARARRHAQLEEAS